MTARAPEGRDPVTGQRLVEFTSIPRGCAVTVAAQDAESVTTAA
jgi:hypothetical protein